MPTVETLYLAPPCYPPHLVSQLIGRIPGFGCQLRPVLCHQLEQLERSDIKTSGSESESQKCFLIAFYLISSQFVGCERDLAVSRDEAGDQTQTDGNTSQLSASCWKKLFILTLKNPHVTSLQIQIGQFWFNVTADEMTQMTGDMLWSWERGPGSQDSW